jgi:hypothetical protein
MNPTTPSVGLHLHGTVGSIEVAMEPGAGLSSLAGVAVSYRNRQSPNLTFVIS